ncbi:MAG: Ig-like domain-containing protein [Gemmatimonadaceae bacterium]|nr:Ig-like domain-containing protein [Gemmatimonadaceae bacterium]
MAGATAYLAAPPTPLRVLRATPADTAGRTASIEITFDRPVAGSLDRSVDPRSIVSVAPTVPGRVEWRDPVTIVLTPAGLLSPATRYVVTVGKGFQAMDGSRLAAPYTFSFRVRAPMLVAGSPAAKKTIPHYLTPTSGFALVYDGPVDLAQLASRAYLAMDASCAGGARAIKLEARAQRRLDKNDPWDYHDYRSTADSLRRVVSLVPALPMPLACGGAIVAPTELALDRPALSRWRFETHGAFKVVKATCESGTFCPTGPIVVRFATPVRGAEVQRHVKLAPAVAFAVADTAEESDRFVLDARLKPHVAYAVIADTLMRDIFGQPLTGNPATGYRTTGYEPSIDYAYGRITVERGGFGTLAIAHVNVDTLVVIAAPIPDSLEGAFIRRSEWNLGDLWTKVRAGARETRIPIALAADKPGVTGIKMPMSPSGKPTLWAVQVERSLPDTTTQRNPTIAVVQVTDLGVHAKIGAESGVVWVTGASDGKPRAGATVTLYDYTGQVAATATTDAQGLASLSGFHGKPAAVRDTAAANESGEGESDEGGTGGGFQLFEGYVAASLGSDRALVGVSAYDPDLDPWRFNISPAWGGDRVPAAGALFTERGIYRPGDLLYAKAIVRTGPLGALAVPAKADSMRWLFTTRDGGSLLDSVVALSSFGTADVSIRIPTNAAIGSYPVQIQTKRGAQWLPIGDASYRVAEYRAPEFLVDVTGSDAPRFPGDSMHANVQARYLFGAPMGRAKVTWQAWQSPAYVTNDIKGAEGYFIGDNGWWWEDEANTSSSNVQLFANGTDTLDASGARTLAVELPEPKKGRAVRVSLAANVMDVNRQTSGARTSVLVHPASFYIGAKAIGSSFFWTAGKPQQIGIIAVKPAGGRVRGVQVHGVVARREWHQVHRERDGVAETVGEWVTDTIAKCDVTTADDPVPCSVTPAAGGTYTVTLRATDDRKRDATTTFYRWATGTDWVPWDDESRLKVDVIADRTSYVVGDTATVLFASPFTDAEAWITVEREGLIEQRRMTLTSGSTTLKFPITEAFAPNAFVSIFIARGRSTPPGHLDDPGRPTIRVGYTELRVTPEVKRLAVEVTPTRAELRPGDSASIAVRVRDAKGAGQRSEVTLWAVDEGVLALTGYKTPDPIDQIYRARGIGMRLASNMASVAPQIPEGEKGFAPGGGGGADRSDVLRSQFKTTAFFLGSVVTDADGRAIATAKLPDNLTTFKVMAVAVTAGDRYGNGESKLLVTRQLVARAALPRFVRPGDAFTAGAVVNQRAGGTPTVRVDASAAGGAELRGDKSKSATLEAGRGREVRFSFRATPADTATFRFGATSGKDADAVQTRVPVRAEYLPHYLTVAGVLRDSGSAEMTLASGLDAARSRVTFSLGASPVAVLRGLADGLRVYPYDCTEQVTSAALPLLALLNAKSDTTLVRARMQRDVTRAVAVISARQRADGGIGLWHARDWTSPWLSEYAGSFLVAAKHAGVTVDDSVLARLAEYLRKDLNTGATSAQFTPIASWYNDRHTRLSDRVASVDYLSRIGKPDVAAEHQLVALAAQLWWEDRLRLAEVLARRGATKEATTLIAPAWALVHLEGTRAVLPPSARHDFYFASQARPMARLLTATLAVNPTHPLIGPIVQALLEQSRTSAGLWNTQDQGSTASALAMFEQRQQGAAARGIRVRAAGRTIIETTFKGTDSSVSLAGLVTTIPGGAQKLKLALDVPKGDGLAYYYITVTEVPKTAPVRPEDTGIQVERWYESYDKPTPLVSVAEGELVRVRMRVTIKSERHFLVLDDPLPAGLEAVDLSLRTAAALPGPGAAFGTSGDADDDSGGDSSDGSSYRWGYGTWDSGWWSPWDHKEIRDDRVVYVATYLWPGVYTASYIARATTPGVFMRPPAHAEEMYNPAVSGRSDGGVFTVTPLASKGGGSR